MKGGKKPHGFTIVETMIFLAVSGVLLVSAITVINGKVNSTEFNEGTRQVQNDLQSAISDVSEGEYQNNGGISCASVPGSQKITIPAPGNPAQGSNFGCEFIGEAIQFQTSQYSIIPIAGAAYKDTNLTPTTSVNQADPHAVTQGTSIQTNDYPYGLQLIGINSGGGWQQNAPSTIGPATLAFLTVGGSSGSYNTSVSLYPLSGTTLSQLPPTTAISDQSSYTTFNPVNGVELCFQGGVSNRLAVITLGGSNNPTNVSLKIENGPPCT